MKIVFNTLKQEDRTCEMIGEVFVGIVGISSPVATLVATPKGSIPLYGISLVNTSSTVTPTTR